MRKGILVIATLCLSIAASAQDLAKKIPYNANAVVTINGENITDLLSVEEFSNSKLGKMLGKEISKISKDEINSLEAIGLDFSRDFHYFLESDSGIFTNVFLIPLENPEGFTKLLPQRERELIVQEGNISYFQDDYDGTVTLWDANTLVVIFSKDTNKDDYDDYGLYDYYPPQTAYEVPQVVEENAAEEVEMVEEEAVEEEIVEEIIVDKEFTEGIELEPVAPYDSNIYDNDTYKKQQEEREKRRLEREAVREEKRKELAIATLKRGKEVLQGNYSNGSILSNPSYTKSIGKGKEEASFWINDFAQIYKEAIPSYMLSGLSNPYEIMDIDKLYGGVSLVGKLNFEEEQVALSLLYSMNDQMAKIYRPMYDGKFNKSFYKYLNEDKLLGYMSINISTEGTLDAYPELIDEVFRSGKNETMTNAVTLGTTLFATLIDEEAAATIIRGDMLLAVTDIQEKEVTYTDYEYDEDYNYKEVERTKTETIPDFLFMFSSEQEAMFNKFMNIGVSEGKVVFDNGIYKIDDLGASNPFDIYVMFKDDAVIIGSSKTHMTGIKNDSYPSKLSNKHKKNLSNNATAAYVNGDKIVSEIPVDAFPRELRDKIDFIVDNTNDMNLSFSKIKGNTMKGEFIWETPADGHKNSFAYFFNMMEALLEK